VKRFAEPVGGDGVGQPREHLHGLVAGHGVDQHDIRAIPALLVEEAVSVHNDIGHGVSVNAERRASLVLIKPN